jgi:hypothetical protein
MKHRRVCVLATALVWCLPLTANADGGCDRACLDGMVDTYLAALKSRDPSRLPVTGNVRFTENTVELPLGEGLWQTIGSVEPYRLYIADPQAGQVGYFGVVKENGTVNVFGLRMKIVERRIAEIETMVSRNNPFIEPSNLVSPRPGLSQALSSTERLPRAELIKAANQYFEGIEQSTDKVVPFSDECTRMENGVLTAGAAVHGLKPRSDMELVPCRKQFELGAFYTTSIAPRRYPIVDEERGLVMAVATLNVPATRTRLKLSDGTTKKASGWALSPFSGPLMEVFKIKGGRIHEIEAVMMPLLPYKAGDGWSSTK